MGETYTLLIDGEVHETELGERDGALLISPDELSRTTGWELKAQGLCKDDACVPAPQLAEAGGVDLNAFAKLLERPLALDEEERGIAIGASSRARTEALQSLEAPDFALPDLAGKIHRLSDYRGKKILLAAFASW